ncbi:MAG: Fic family protein [Candidatus Cybelea sp.]
MSRRQRQGGSYYVYIPDPLVGRPFVLNGDVAADVADAEREIAAFDKRTSTLEDTEALARLLLRAESVASSRIEGLIVGPRRLLKADMARQIGEPVNDVTEVEVLANIDAMAFALKAANDGGDFSTDLLLEIHTELLKQTNPDIVGVIRTRQNWIGKSGSPLEADFIPPPPEYVKKLVADLCEFCNSDSLPAVAQAAIAHAQFETIHPFPDGNGRVGRALIHMILRRRGLTSRVTPPVSLVLATFSKDYIAGLTATHYEGEPFSPEAISGTDKWVETFAAACRRSVKDASLFEQRIHEVQGKWLASLGHVRSNSAVERLIVLLPGAPLITSTGVAKLLDITLPPALQAIERLVDAGILSPTKVGRKRGQVYEAREIIDTFTALERQLASPAGDTQIEEPVRDVPKLR